VYDHDLGELEDLGWDEFVRRQWDAVYTAYRTGRGRRTLCRGWADLIEAGLSCSQALADLLVRTEILDRADRDLEGTVDPRALVIGMTEVIADVRVDLLEFGLEEPGFRELGAAGLAGLLDRQAALLGFVRDYAGVEDASAEDAGVGNPGVEDTG
jgi:hypothetical protein